MLLAISYNKLWKLLIDNGMTKVQPREITGMRPGTLAKLSKNQRVSLDVLERICKKLDYNFGDILNCKKEKEK